MEVASFFISVLAFSIASMDLVLSIVYTGRVKTRWVNHFIVYSATVLAAAFFLLLERFSSLYFDGNARKVLFFLFDILLVADAAFLFNYIPFVVTKIIAHPWRNPYKTIFLLTSILFVGASIAGYFVSGLLFTNIRFICFFFIVFFCISVVLKNYNSITIGHVRKTLMAIAIVSFSLIPIIIAGLFFDSLKALCIPILLMASTICILVYLFVDIVKRGEKLEMLEKRKPLTVESLSKYHITEREFSVIGLIKEGLTNKEIAARLGISVNTVNNHIANVFSKTQVRSRIDLLNLLEETGYGEISGT
jgi:Response regulator containing a CheY-like receiver domain and an HTH DNA-binding domain